MEQIIRCNELLIEAPKLIAEFTRLARPALPPDQRRRVADAYLAWYAAGQSVILADLRAYFQSRYTDRIGGAPSLRDLTAQMMSPAEPDPHHYMAEYIAFKWTIEEQCEVLRMTRRAIFPRRPQIPEDLRLAFATLCMRIYHTFSIDQRFIDNGCLLTWWMPPLKPVASQRMGRALGWLDGIVLFAPAREAAIARAVCEDIRRKPRLPAKAQVELAALLDQLAQMGQSLAPAPALDQETEHRQVVLERQRERLRHLEHQAATQGYHTPPAILMEIDDLRRQIQASEQDPT